MSTWAPGPGMESDDDLKAADELLGKADALLRRHHRSTEPSEPDVFVALEDEDLPVLTDVVDPSELSAAALAPPTPAEAPVAPPQHGARNRLAEQLVGLDTEISREVEAWFATEFPQLLSRELDRFSDRLQEETLAHLRATLLPALSDRISHRLEDESDDPH